MAFDGRVEAFHVAPPPSASESEAQRLIRDARARVEAGWTKGAFRIGDGVCLRGAFLEAMGERIPQATQLSPARQDALVEREFKCCAYGFMAEAVREHLNTVFLPVVDDPYILSAFNDFPTTEKADVLAVLDRAYELAGRT